MAKLTLSDIGNLRPPAIGTINSNSASIETALENTLSRDGTSPNQMAAVLDMNSNRIINLPDAIDDQEPLTLGQYMGGSGAVGAPTNGSYLVVSSNATLINERVLTAGTGIALTDAGANSTLTVNLANTAATPGTYGSGGTVVPTITVDAQGRITAVSNTGISVGTYVAGSGLTLTGNSFSITSLGVTNAMLAGSITAAKLVGSDIATVGTLTAGATGAGFTVALSTSTITGTLAAARMPALTGDITTTVGTVATTLATVNANTGSFGSSTAIPTFTVNGKGLITAASTAVVIAPAGTLTGTTLASNVVTSSLTSVGTLTGGSTGAGFTVALSTSTITGTLGASNLPALTGDITTTAGTVATTLATVNANTGSFGSSTAIPTFTVNGKGLITAASTAVVIAPAGTLTGTTLAANVVTSSLTGVGTLTSGATGAGFTVALSTSTITGTLGAARMPALTGDITTTVGTVATTLATVNSNVGSFGSSTAIPTFTVNGKGLITAASTAVVIAPAGTLTGTTLASNVVTSSLTSVGTLTGGATGTGFTVDLTNSTITGTLADARLPTSMATKTFTGTTTLSGPVLITDTTASTTTGTGALIVSGGVGVAGSINSGNLATALTFKSTGTPAANATLTSTATVTIANGASSPLAIATGKGLIFITELSFSGDIGLYAVANGNATVLISPGGFFVNATTTPAAGHASIAYDGVSTMKIYNNSGVSSIFNVIQIVV